MVEKRNPISVNEAVKRIMACSIEAPKEDIPLTAAYNRFLATDIVATTDVPAFDRSPYDGYAIVASSSISASTVNPITFKVVGEIGAGYVHNERVHPFEAVRIMTGAPIPLGCDAVVMLELTHTYEENGERFMTVKRSFEAGTNISYKGEDIQNGEVLVKKGTVIHPGIISLLATFGYATVSVYKKLVVGVLSTGSELLEPHEPLQPGKIRNSNAYTLLAQIERAGAEPKYLGKLNDDLPVCIERVKKALFEADILITTGGVSVGDYDYLPAIYEALGANVLFNKVAMRPGSVTTVAELNGQLLFGLSGNPSACYVGFELLTRPIIRYAYFNSRPHLRREKAVLGADFKKANPFTRFIRASLTYENERAVATPAGFNKSSSISSLINTDVLIVLPGGSRGYEQGMIVDILLLENQQGSVWPWDTIQKYSKS